MVCVCAGREPAWSAGPEEQRQWRNYGSGLSGRRADSVHSRLNSDGVRFFGQELEPAGVMRAAGLGTASGT